MAKIVLKDAWVSVNSVVLSTRVKSVSFPIAPELLEAFAMGDNSKTKMVGLSDWSVDVEFYQDFTATAGQNVDATLWAVWSGGVAVPIGIRATSAAASATNPQYGGNVVLASYNPIGGTAGQVAMAPVKFECGGDLTRTP